MQNILNGKGFLRQVIKIQWYRIKVSTRNTESRAIEKLENDETKRQLLNEERDC